MPPQHRRGLLLRLVERLYAWLQRRDDEAYRRAHPEWWARVQAHYREADRGRAE